MNELSKRLWSADCWLRCTELLINAYEQNKPYDLICRGCEETMKQSSNLHSP